MHFPFSFRKINLVLLQYVLYYIIDVVCDILEM